MNINAELDRDSGDRWLGVSSSGSVRSTPSALPYHPTTDEKKKREKKGGGEGLGDPPSALRPTTGSRLEPLYIKSRRLFTRINA